MENCMLWYAIHLVFVLFGPVYFAALSDSNNASTFNTTALMNVEKFSGTQSVISENSMGLLPESVSLQNTTQNDTSESVNIPPPKVVSIKAIPALKIFAQNSGYILLLRIHVISWQEQNSTVHNSDLTTCSIYDIFLSFINDSNEVDFIRGTTKVHLNKESKMTVSYHLELASISRFAISRVLFRWKGSVWKHIYKDIFENLAVYFDTRLEYIPITFILGFFVDTILSRWSDIFVNMGYIESYALFITNYINGESENAKQLRRTMVRYLCLTQVFVFRDISVPVRKRFPTTDSMIDAGILLKEEKEKLDLIELQYNRYWVPIRWIHAAALDARKDEIITSDLFYWKLCAEADNFRYNLQLLCNYDWVPIPLIYSQVVFLAVYIHFLICLVSRQLVVSNDALRNDLDLIVPVMTIIQFIFFIGWLKVAQALLNPFGDDDDDFECNYLIDKNLTNHPRTIVPPQVQYLYGSSLQSHHLNLYWTHLYPKLSPIHLILRLELTNEQGETINYRSQSASFQKLSRTSQCANQDRDKTMKGYQTSSIYNDLTINDLHKIMNINMSHNYRSGKLINQPSVQLAQYSTPRISYFVSVDPSMNKDNSNEVKITRL
ncbi:Bestrophin-1 [Dirofilaria immitis]|nr:Bestrophin-1 [Dirofilaria immitis]